MAHKSTAKPIFTASWLSIMISARITAIILAHFGMVTSGFFMNTLLVWKNSAISKQRLGNFYDRVIWYLAEQKVSNYDHKLKDCFDFSLE